MTEKAQHIADLLIKRLQGEITPIEEEQLKKWMDEKEGRRQAIDDLLNADIVAELLREQYAYEKRGVIKLINDQMPQVALRDDENTPNIRPAHRVHFLKKWGWAAAILLIVFGTAVYFNYKKTYDSVLTNERVPDKHDIRPGYNRAILTLSNGKKITLDTATSETIHDGSLSIQHNSGQLNYTNANIVASNTMTTPRGGQYQLVLADGTKVWLNAASSITYPTAFKGKTREVIITGEVYLDIKEDKDRPFIVQTKDGRIEVLGTEFNINAYDDEQNSKTTLISGKIKINGTILMPAQAYAGGKIVSTNPSQDVAWKNGRFDFDELTIQEAMRQLERWYDIKVVYKQKLPATKLFGGMDRGLNLSEALQILKAININFELKDRILTILP